MEEIYLNIFIAYSREDFRLRERLDKHLSGLKRRNFINTWYDGDIDAGKDWEKEIDNNLSKADIILLLISADFIGSDYCYDVEMKKAINRHEKGEAVIIPILLNPCDWSELPFSKIQALPQNGKPITSNDWENPEIAFNEIAISIKKIVEDLRITKGKHLKSINEVLKDKQNELKITFEQIEDLTLEEEILDESISKMKIESKNINEQINNQKQIFSDLQNTFNSKKNEYDSIINKEQISINKIRSEREQLILNIEQKLNELKKLEQKKINIEEDIKRMKK